MAKKFGSLVFLAAVAGAAAGVVSYLYKYQKFSEEVDQDFTDVVDSAMEVKDSAKRSYTILKDSRTKEDFKAVAKDLGFAAKNLAIDTKNLAVDAGKDAYKAVREAFDKKKSEFMDDEEAVDSEDVDVEFYYDDDVVDSKENKEVQDENTGNADTKKLEDSVKEEGSGLVVTEEV